MPILYTFRDRQELIAALRAFATGRRTRAQTYSERSHKFTELMAEARVYDDVATMLLNSNVMVRG